MSWSIEKSNGVDLYSISNQMTVYLNVFSMLMEYRVFNYVHCSLQLDFHRKTTLVVDEQLPNP